MAKKEIVPKPRFTAMRRTNDTKKAENRRINTDISTMKTGEILGRLYERHSTGFWMTWAMSATIMVVVSLIS